MALQDVCGFQDLDLCPPCNPLASGMPYENGSFYSQIYTHHGNFNLTETEASGAPLCFSIPKSKSPKSNDPISTHHPSPGSPRPPASVAAPFRLCHGTTTLAFAFQGGVIAAADSRASAGGLVACPAVEKISPIHSHLVVTSSGSGADCMLWERILTREIRLYQLRHGRRLSVGSSAKLLSLMLHPFKGTDVCVALTLCGWDTVGQRWGHGQRQGQGQGQGQEEGQGGTETSWGGVQQYPMQYTHAVTSSNKLLSVCEEPTTTSCCCCSDTSPPVNVQSDLEEPETRRKRESPEGNQVDAFMSSSRHDQSREIQTASDESPAKSSLNTTHAPTAAAAATPLVGPRLCYVCSDGAFLKGELFSVGSGSPYAYSVLDGSVRWEMCEEEAVSVAREAVYRATHRDAYSGNSVDLYHVTERGWRRRPREDLREEYHKERERERERERDE